VQDLLWGMINSLDHAPYADGYPTKEKLAKFLEAHKNGSKGAIKALLQKRRAALNQTENSAPDA
jgi:hypothetical protein